MLKLGHITILLLAAVLNHGRWLGTAQALDGQQLYLRHCASCHGENGWGNGKDASAFAEKPRSLRESYLRKYSTEELVRRVREGKSLELAVDATALRVRSRDVEALVEYLNRLPAIDWRLVGDGWTLYSSRCEACHDHYGHPVEKGLPGVRRPRDLSTPLFQRSVTEKNLDKVVRHGRKDMPALTPRVPEAAVKPLAAYVRVLSPGFELYSRYCANCHGDDGLGADAPAGSIGVPSVKFDRAYFAASDPEKLRADVWHMFAVEKPAMPHFGWLISEAQARVIVEYLKQLDP